MASAVDEPAPSASGAGRIQVLPPEVAAKIAAGEVVERPASVVKELVENALDAGARRVVVELEDGGVRLIRVTDDGAGMTRDEAVVAFTRHATSKLRHEDDLDRIATLGFRGEALPSIAAVADVELVTRTAEDLGGTVAIVTGGRVAEVRDAGAPPGTSVTVRELFAPVPARRKFLKSTATELGHVVDLVARHALASLDVHFRLLHHGREVAVYPPVATLDARARQVFGAERVVGGRTFAGERLGLGVDGFTFSPQLSFASARYLHAFVNGRAVRDRGLQHAIVEGYASLIPRGRWPGAVVRLRVPPADVDVNVHPAKHEVRFRLARVVHDSVLALVRGALAGPGAAATRRDAGAVAEALERYAAVRPAPAEAFLPGHAPAGRLAAAGVGEGGGRAAEAPAAWKEPPGILVAIAEGPRGRPQPRPQATTGFAGLRVVGQVFRGYLVCEGTDRLLLVDQHAAHERIAFERLHDQYRAGAVERQTLLLPVTVDLDPRRAEALLGAERELRTLGFELEPFGEHTVLVRAVPALLGASDPRLLVEDVADGLGERGSHQAAGEAADAILGRIACHSVVRVGRPLGPAEVERLLADLDGLAHGTSCAHGRPVSIEFTRGQVERMFGR